MLRSISREEVERPCRTRMKTQTQIQAPIKQQGLHRLCQGVRILHSSLLSCFRNHLKLVAIANEHPRKIRESPCHETKL